MKNILILSIIGLAATAIISCNGKKQDFNTVTPPPPIVEQVDPPDAPPRTWKENWFEHTQLLNRIYYDTSVVVYYDGDVKANLVTWPKTYMAEAWNYTKKVYGKFGTDSRLFVIYHSGKYGGGHPGTYLADRHNFRNVTDCGGNSLDAWLTGTGNDIDLSTHEIGHIVEGASRGVKESPAWDIWHDSKWMEIYQYDVYLGLNRTADAERWFNMMQATTDSYPRAGTQWFKNWFYPIYNTYGKTKTLSGFFLLLSQYFPKKDITVQGKPYKEYTRRMNFGEFIHFFSGSSKADLESLALSAFGPKDEKGADWAPMLVKARTDFPEITALYK